MAERSCERYDMGGDKWGRLPDFDNFMKGISIIVTEKRYVHAFGGKNNKCENSEKELIRTLDHLRL
jgi:hypothetical protein